MAKFPKEEAKILTLAREMLDGLDANTDIYPNPTVATTEFEAILDRCVKAREAAIAAHAVAEEATSAKNRAMTSLIEVMRSEIRYAENETHFDDAKLKLIGWSGRKARSHLAAPGQVGSLSVSHQGPGKITLAWKKPMDGGAVAAYKVLRRERAAGDDWMDAGVATERTIHLSGQERGRELEYCVVAINKAGPGEASNSVTVVL
uniref:Fibronectin type III domain-containing protein n=1 Tax=Candidatus Kentrum eta TaxID=2126337 RepID=A0A450UWU6_9GAMM|nr:MAG: Fibronectin type III domain-containing protein [Candidatus Kentron sp. H]VFJ90353.1 MAG: Fibronectin type III domain-containing protein [Candidatus Kentron sp. H]VFJ97014.1 MAG: Fibronectin type III domain-containing protein [Candidatus Kentron sp. H]